MANLFASLFGTGRPKPGIPMDAATAKTTPDATYLENMQKLLKGDVSSALTGGEKLMALGALLRSAARGSQVTPQEVMSQVRQTAQTRAATQLQLAQLQAKAQQEQKQKAFISQYASVLPEKQRGVLENMDTAEAFKTVSTEAFRPKQVQQIVRDAQGNTRITYQDGTSQIADWKLPAKTEYKDVGDKLVLVDSDSGEQVRDEAGNFRSLPKNLSPYEVQSLGLRREEMGRADARARMGGVAAERGQLVPTDQGYAVWSPRAQTLRPLNSPLKPKSSDPLAQFSAILGGSGVRRFGQ